MANKTIYIIPCIACDNGTMNVKYFNDSDKCKKYAHCSCGGNFRCNNNQQIFAGNAAKYNEAIARQQTASISSQNARIAINKNAEKADKEASETTDNSNDNWF